MLHRDKYISVLQREEQRDRHMCLPGTSRLHLYLTMLTYGCVTRLDVLLRQCHEPVANGIGLHVVHVRMLTGFGTEQNMRAEDLDSLVVLVLEITTHKELHTSVSGTVGKKRCREGNNVVNDTGEEQACMECCKVEGTEQWVPCWRARNNACSQVWC
jgi:hypothetical protein